MPTPSGVGFAQDPAVTPGLGHARVLVVVSAWFMPPRSGGGTALSAELALSAAIWLCCFSLAGLWRLGRYGNVRNSLAIYTYRYTCGYDLYMHATGRDRVAVAGQQLYTIGTPI
jgi:hypothetical protein